MNKLDVPPVHAVDVHVFDTSALILLVMNSERPTYKALDVSMRTDARRVVSAATDSVKTSQLGSITREVSARTRRPRVEPSMPRIAAPGVGYVSFREIFTAEDGRRVRLTVPNYQRAYDWSTEQREDLFGDLERLAILPDPDRSGRFVNHFCGTIICTPLAEDSDHLRYEIVDGQQRLTTLVLMHTRLAGRANMETFVYSGTNALFRPQSADADYFAAVARNLPCGQPGSVGQRRYELAAKEISRWIDALGENNCRRMTKLVEERLQFIFFALPDSNEVSKVFETINNRGKPLTQMDLVKNHLIYTQHLHGWDGNVDAVWTEIQQLALRTQFRGGENIDTVLRAVITAMFRPGRRATGETDYKVVKAHICEPEHAERFRRFLAFLKASFETFCRLRGSWTSARNDEIGTQLTYLNQHPNLSGMLPLVFARQFCRRDEQGANVLEAIEKANFRLYGLMNAAKRSDSYHISLHNLAHDYFEKHCGFDTDPSAEGRRALSRSLIDELTRIVIRQQKDGVSQIVKALTLDDDDPTDYYHWDALRYFLARWEESLMNNQSFEYGRLGRTYRDSHSNDYLAREHIYPASYKGSLAEYREGLQLRRLGNLMLLPQGINSSLGDRSPAEKAEALAEHGRHNALLVQNAQLGELLQLACEFRERLEQRDDAEFDRIGATRFNRPTREENAPIVEAKTLCDLREEMMVRFALETWRMPGEALGEREEECFLGLFSFCFDGEAYRADRETPAVKETTNYVLDFSVGATGTSNNRLVALHRRLARRNEILGRNQVRTSWTCVPPTERKAA